jgi:hypothetical protein
VCLQPAAIVPIGPCGMAGSKSCRNSSRSTSSSAFASPSSPWAHLIGPTPETCAGVQFR